MKASPVVILAVAVFPLALAVPSTAQTQTPPASPAPPSPSPEPPASPAPAPEASPAGESPSFPAQVEQVTVDVVVTDKKGVPIPGLGREAFVLTEDGDAQAIASFEAIQVPATSSVVPAARPRVSTNTAREVQTGRTFVVVFDDIHLTPGQARRAKVAVTEFLTKGVREGDRVSLVATGGGAWWTTRMEAGREELITLLKRLDGRFIPDTSPERMTDYEAMRINIYRDPQVIARVARRYDAYGVNLAGSTSRSPSAAGIEPNPFISARATEVYYQASAKNRITLEVMERVLSSLGGTKGRKAVILVSEGFIYDPNMDEFKKVVQASRRSNAAIYFLDTRGLEGMPLTMTAQFGSMVDEQDIGAAFSESIEASEGSESLASDSGGFSVKNTNDLASGIRRIADESQAYYLLGYNPTNTRRDGHFRKIQVKVPSGKGYQIRARKGYYAPLEGRNALAAKPGAPDPAIQAALDSPYDAGDIPLRMTAYVLDETILGKANVVVVIDTDVREFAFHEEGGRFLDTLEFLLVAAHRESGEYYRYDQQVDMKLLPATREKIVWYPMSRDFELAPGGYQAKIVVRDKNSGRIGTLVHEFEVPPLGPFRVSTPILSDTMQPAPTGEKTPQPTMLARRDFPAGSMLLAQFEVYGAAKDKASGMPRVTAGYDIRRPDGTVLTHVEPTPIQPTSLGRLMRLVGTRLVDHTPGDYEMVLTLKDEIAGKALELREPFSVSPAAPPAS
jgi:VWFA-related protein